MKDSNKNQDLVSDEEKEIEELRKLRPESLFPDNIQYPTQIKPECKFFLSYLIQ